MRPSSETTRNRPLIGPVVIKQPGWRTHIVDGGHEEQDDANDVNGKDGSEEDQHGDCAGERGRDRGETCYTTSVCHTR